MDALGQTGKLAFGPVPSRRLGRSLGINNIPAKSCTYSCVYCQVGNTLTLTAERQHFYTPRAIFSEVKKKVDEGSLRNENADYLTFVSNGEPTLDVDIGREISSLKSIGIPVAVLTNASLMWRRDVQEDLLGADLVSVKVDAVSEDLWKEMNRPHKNLRLHSILKGIMGFAEDFEGVLISETMLVDGINYGNEFERIADLLGQVEGLDKAYLAIPARPPAEKWVKPAKEDVLNTAFQAFADRLGQNEVECLTGYEGNAFASTGEPESDLLSITAVHPMRREAVEELLNKSGASWDLIKRLIHERKLVELGYEGTTFYLRRLLGR